MPKPGYGSAHQRNRRLALAQLVDGTPCPLCGRPMHKRQALDLDHTIPAAMGGIGGPTRLTHAYCNRSAGARLGNRMRNPFHDSIQRNRRMPRIKKRRTRKRRSGLPRW